MVEVDFLLIPSAAVTNYGINGESRRNPISCIGFTLANTQLSYFNLVLYGIKILTMHSWMSHTESCGVCSFQIYLKAYAFICVSELS